MDQEKIKDETNPTPLSSGRGVGGEVELRSDEVQEILGRPPHALVRYGISLMSSIVFLLFIGAFFFRYPDIVQGEVVITTENPPVWLVAKSSGRIKELLCTDKQKVNQGAVLAVIDNPANTEDVIHLKLLLDSLQLNDSACYIPNELFTKQYELGTIQTYFTAFTKAALNYTNFRTLNLTTYEKSSVLKQIEYRKIYNANLLKQLDLKKKELLVVKSMYERDKLLFSRKVISASDMELSEQNYLLKQQDLQQLQTSISMQNVEYAQVKESVNKLSMQYLSDKNQLLSELKSAKRELITSIESWQQTYALCAPQAGVVTFNAYWKKNQFINAGDKVFAIVSLHQGALLGKMKVPVNGFGKIAVGQSVNIKVSGYPYMEFGLLKAKINKISLVANNDNYSVEAILPEGLTTTVNKKLNFTGELDGTAEIITEDRSLIERIYSPIEYLLKKNF